ncbi:MAG TPA: OB-fold domain-containing protein [Steroidobacteraceae bacterium]|jgi:hypothetical protein
MKRMMNDTRGIERNPIRPSNFSQPYWDGTRERRLLLQFCPITHQYQFYPRPVSIFTGRQNLEWREVAGNRTIYSYTIAELGPGPFRGQEPYLIALVELNMHVRVLANIVECDAEQIKIGMPVQPDWLPLKDGTHLLMFRPRLMETPDDNC